MISPALASSSPLSWAMISDESRPRTNWTGPRSPLTTTVDSATAADSGPTLLDVVLLDVVLLDVVLFDAEQPTISALTIATSRALRVNRGPVTIIAVCLMAATSYLNSQVSFADAPPVEVVAIEARGLVKRFGKKVAVDHLDLTVAQGSWFGLVGPNGAGKTTTIKMLVGLLRPDEGNVRIDGVSVWPDPLEAKRRIGVLPDDLRLFERLSGRELLVYVGLLRGLKRDQVDMRAEQLLDVLGLLPAENDLVADYSTGMRKKVALAAALLHAPQLLLLDEPFESVDPVSSRIIVEVLEQYRSGGGTIVFSSHVMDTVERLCDHVAIVSNGNVVRVGPVRELLANGRLEDVFIDAVGALAGRSSDGLDWLSDRMPVGVGQ
jgi:ABC-2 type transport system ATP-binding protein